MGNSRNLSMGTTRLVFNRQRSPSGETAFKVHELEAELRAETERRVP